MKPLIFEYLESPPNQNLDFSIIEYSELKNLNVIKSTQTPAIGMISADTMTFTKASTEGNDSDNDVKLALKQLLDTQTLTLVKSEASDMDNNMNALKMMMDTQTLTESKENTDRDR